MSKPHVKHVSDAKSNPWNPIYNMSSSQRRGLADRAGSQSHRRSESFSERQFSDSTPSARTERDEYYLQGHLRTENYSRAYNNRDREFGHLSNRQHEYSRKNTHTSGVRPFNTGPGVGYTRERSRSPPGHRTSYSYEGRLDQQHSYDPRYTQPRSTTRDYPANMPARHPDAHPVSTRSNRSYSMYANSR